MHSQPQKPAKQIFEQTKSKLMNCSLIVNEFIESPYIRCNFNLEKQYLIDITPYLEDFNQRLRNVPTYVSDDSYVLRKINNIKQLIQELTQIHKQEQTKATSLIDFHLHTQLLSMTFCENKTKARMIRYIYFQVLNSWFSNLFKGYNYFDFMSKYRLLPDEGMLTNNIRIHGEIVYAIYLRDKQWKMELTFLVVSLIENCDDDLLYEVVELIERGSTAQENNIGLIQQQREMDKYQKLEQPVNL